MDLEFDVRDGPSDEGIAVVVKSKEEGKKVGGEGERNKREGEEMNREDWVPTLGEWNDGIDFVLM